MPLWLYSTHSAKRTRSQGRCAFFSDNSPLENREFIGNRSLACKYASFEPFAKSLICYKLRFPKFVVTDRVYLWVVRMLLIAR